MNITDTLLDKYFKGQCTPEEQNVINSFLCEVDQLPDHLVTQEEWDGVEDAVLSEEKTDQLFAKIKGGAFPKVRRMQWVRNVAAAAVIMTILSVGYFMFMKARPNAKIAQNETRQKEKANVTSWKSTYNYGNKHVAVVLPDSSEVKVQPGAEISYKGDFSKEKREVYLKGSAYFKVSADQQHPFIVYAGGVSTTVLGTTFTVTAIEGDHTVSIKLHTGKVLVENIISETAIPSFNKILSPGEILLVNKTTGTVKVVPAQSAMLLADSLTIDCKQMSLPAVFDKLERHFKVKISYDTTVLRTMYFTGTLDLQIPLEQILKDVTAVNKLTPVKTNEGFLIKE